MNKRYADALVINCLGKNGGTLAGDLDMNSHKITDLPVAMTRTEPIINKTFDQENQKLSNMFVNVQGQIDNKVNLSVGTLSGNLDLNQNKILNLPDPTEGNEAAIKSYVDKSHVHPSGSLENYLSYLMKDPDDSSSESNIVVKGINTDFMRNPHKYHMDSYEFTQGKDKQNNYSSVISFNLCELEDEKYSIILEYFAPFPRNMSVFARSQNLQVKSQVSQTFGSYVKALVQVEKTKPSPPEYLYFKLKCSGSLSSPNVATGRLIIYGISGFHQTVSSSVWDRLFSGRDGKFTLLSQMNVNGKNIVGLPSPTNAEDAANKLFAQTSVMGSRTMRGSIRMNQFRIYDLPPPASDSDICNKKYVDEIGLSYVLKAAAWVYMDG